MASSHPRWHVFVALARRAGGDATRARFRRVLCLVGAPWRVRLVGAGAQARDPYFIPTPSHTRAPSPVFARSRFLFEGLMPAAFASYTCTRHKRAPKRATHEHSAASSHQYAQRSKMRSLITLTATLLVACATAAPLRPRTSMVRARPVSLAPALRIRGGMQLFVKTLSGKTAARGADTDARSDASRRPPR